MKGLSLLELLVALAITAILASVAIPSYGGYVARARRVEGQSHMVALLQLQERHFNRHYRYLAFSADEPAPPESGMHWWSGALAADSAYEFSAVPCEGYTLQQCVLIRAQPATSRVSQVLRGDRCGTLEADSRGKRSAAIESRRCWQ